MEILTSEVTSEVNRWKTLFDRIQLHLNLALAIAILLTVATVGRYALSGLYLSSGIRELGEAAYGGRIDKSVVQVTGFSPHLPVAVAPNAGFLRRASRALSHAVHWDDTNAPAYRLLINTYLLQRRFQEANDLLLAWTASHPEDRIGYLRLGDSYAMLGEPGLAFKAWEQGGLLVSSDWYHMLSRGGTVWITPMDMQADQGKVIREDDGPVMVLFTIGAVSADLFFPEIGEYRIAIRGKNSIPGPVVCEIRLDGTLVGTLVWDKNDDTYSTKHLVFEAGWGAKKIEVVFTNDEVSVRGDRNAYVKWIEVQRLLSYR